jgi:hypothetical protein
MDDDKEVMATLQRIDDTLGSGGAAEARTESFNPCQEYDKIRDLLADVIKIISKIPGIGKRIAKVLNQVKAILDMLCPAS